MSECQRAYTVWEKSNAVLAFSWGIMLMLVGPMLPMPYAIFMFAGGLVWLSILVVADVPGGQAR
jgi:hypothetical protein